MSPIDLVRATVKNEILAANNTAIKFSFRSRDRRPRRVENRSTWAIEALATIDRSPKAISRSSPEKEPPNLTSFSHLISHAPRSCERSRNAKSQKSNTL